MSTTGCAEGLSRWVKYLKGVGFFERLIDGSLSALSNRAEDTADSGDEDNNDETDSGRTRWHTNHAGGYFVCSHRGCKKKCNPYITDHDCCGRCTRGRECSAESVAAYDGPGGFAHRAESPHPVIVESGFREAGICTVCGEPLEIHPEYDW